MSRSAHAQSTYELRKLPKCSRCDAEFTLVCVSYIGKKGFYYEWECPKCHKAVPKELLREEPLDPSDLLLQRRVRELTKKN